MDEVFRALGRPDATVDPRRAVRTRRPDRAGAVRPVPGDDPVRRDEAPRRARGRQPRHHRAGRSHKLHFLNPVPIGEIADRWISKYAQPFTRAMVGLRHDLERGQQHLGAHDGHHHARLPDLHPGHARTGVGGDHRPVVDPPLLPRHRVRLASGQGRAVPHLVGRRPPGGRRRDRGARPAAPAGADVARAVRPGDVGGATEPGRLDHRPGRRRPDPAAPGARRPRRQSEDVGQRQGRLGVRARRDEDADRDRASRCRR